MTTLEVWIVFDGARNMNAHSRQLGFAYWAGATASWKFIASPATRIWNDAIKSETYIVDQ